MKDEDVDQLVQDESFLNYVFGRKDGDITYWEGWLRLHPEHMEEVTGLKQRLINMAQASEEKVVSRDFAKLHERINGAEKVKKTDYSIMAQNGGSRGSYIAHCVRKLLVTG